MLPFWGFDQWTKVAIEAREAKGVRQAEGKRDAAYMATSPGAAYGAGRNKRLLQKAEESHYNKVEEAEDDFDMNGSDMMTKSQENLK